MRTLVYHTGGLGDFITLLPLLELLNASGSITLLGKPAHGALARANGQVDECIDSESSRYAFLFTLNTPVKELSAFLSVFDTLCLFTSTNSPLIVNAQRCFAGKIYRQNPIPNERIPICDYRARLFEPDAMLQPGPPDLTNAISHYRSRQMAIRHLHLPAIAIHPGSGSNRKNWPFERFLMVADLFRTAGFSVCWFSGEAEKNSSMPPTDTHYHHPPLSEAAAHLSQCSLYLGNDSGFSHLAAAAGCPSVVLFGSSDPAIWAPRGINNVFTIYRPRKCSPCHLTTKMPCSSPCLTSISVEEVAAACYSLL